MQQPAQFSQSGYGPYRNQGHSPRNRRAYHQRGDSATNSQYGGQRTFNRGDGGGFNQGRSGRLAATGGRLYGQGSRQGYGGFQTDRTAENIYRGGRPHSSTATATAEDDK